MNAILDVSAPSMETMVPRPAQPSTGQEVTPSWNGDRSWTTTRPPESVEVGDDWCLVSYSVVSGSKDAPEAVVTLKRDHQDPVSARASGDGPVDAVLKAIRDAKAATAAPAGGQP